MSESMVKLVSAVDLKVDIVNKVSIDLQDTIKQVKDLEIMKVSDGTGSK